MRENSEKVFLLFTAHSIPLAMSENCDYVKQLQHSSKLIAQHAGFKNFDVVYQSRSGPAHVPWLDPDVCTVLPSIKNRGYDGALVMPLGFCDRSHGSVV
ncbi:MAG: ferrochelatase [Bdellovibrionota bacterium]